MAASRYPEVRTSRGERQPLRRWALFLLDVPEHGDRRGHVAAHVLAPRHGLHVLAERHGDALADDARLDLLGDLELLLGLGFPGETTAPLLHLLLHAPP